MAKAARTKSPATPRTAKVAKVTKVLGAPGAPAAKAGKAAKAGRVVATRRGRSAVAVGAPFDATDAGSDIEDQDDSLAGKGNGKSLVIVESPAKAKTINKYLGPGFRVLASVGHVRDLPASNPKGVKKPVPGVDLDNDFAPTYVVMEDKGKVVSDLKKAARNAREIWFATDPDREGEAIAWHVAEELGVDPLTAKRVMFNAITKDEIQKAFSNPRPINMDRVNAQQARRIVDRIVGYQVSPLLWKKVARGLSAGRVQSVAVRLIVDREREIRAFIPDEMWNISANFSPKIADGAKLAADWAALLATKDEKGDGPTIKTLTEWLGTVGAVRAELVDIGGKKFELLVEASELEEKGDDAANALADRAMAIVASAGLLDAKLTVTSDPKGRGPAKFVRTISGRVDPTTPYKIASIETSPMSRRPAPPFITSTLQQTASSALGFGAQRTMSTAQQLYMGVDIPGEGPVALITYMRTDSTHLSADAIKMVRDFVPQAYGPKYLPEKPNFFASSNKDAQEAHEAIRPTSLDPKYHPARLRNVLKPDQFRIYELIWKRFVSCQMTNAEWDSTTVLITGGKNPATPLTFKATGRVLRFDGFYKVMGVPKASDEQNLPAFTQGQPVAPFAMEPRQRFGSPPERYTEASLIKKLELEGIGRPSTYASIISVIQDRKYVELESRRFFASALGEAVTDKLIEAFPDLMDLGYTRDMEADLDKVEDEHLDWVKMLHRFYDPFAKRLGEVENTLTHAKAETTPAPHICPTCNSGTVYRLGKSGRFLSCASYPACKYAAPVDRDGVPRTAEFSNIACPVCSAPMIKRTGKFGPFLGCSKYSDKDAPCATIVKIDKKGFAVARSPQAFTPNPALPCPKCAAAMYLRPGKYGPWLGCSKFPKCRGRGDFKKLPDAEREALLKQLEAHQKLHPSDVIKTIDGEVLTGTDGKPLPGAKLPALQGDLHAARASAAESFETAADDMGL